MKTLSRAGLLGTLLAMSGIAQADWSANVGYASEYHFRGILQKTSSASGGLDYESGGFYVGTWAADVGDGLEVDGYFGYGTEIGEVSLGIGYTGYFYTGDFDDTYQEINLSAGIGIFTLDVAVGEYDSPPNELCNPTASGCSRTSDYTYYSLTAEKNGFYGKFGGFSQDFEGEYFEVGYGMTIAEIDFGLSVIFANDDLVGEADESLIFTIGKSFDL
ncbi:hypothetical protein GWP57_10380 [Gammaproteobacteria bacterium]|jgi:uncharacterized protein (TIGR02001 family)|nr:hypothetical protein [Gammaproteobacteria bacterium]